MGGMTYGGSMAESMAGAGDLERGARIERKLRLAAGLLEFAWRIKINQVRRREPGVGLQEARRKAYDLIDRAAR